MAIRKPFAGVPSDVGEPIQIPTPIAGVPKRLTGGTSFTTQAHSAPERELVEPIADVPGRARGAIDALTEYHEEPVTEVNLLTPVEGIPKRVPAGSDERTEYHEEPPPPPDIAFVAAPSRVTPLRAVEPQSVFTTIGVFPSKARVRRGLYDDYGLYSRDV